MVRHRLNPDRHAASLKVDRHNTVRFAQRKERIGHQVLRIAQREIAKEVARGVDPAAVTIVHNVITSSVVPEVVAEQGARVRLLRRTESAPRSVAWQDPNEIDLAFARCLRALVPAPGYLAVATWQQRLIDVTGSVAALHDRDPATFEYTLPLGVRADEQRRIADAGQQLRVLVPYGPRWRPYVRERMAERPRAGVQAVWRPVRPRSAPIIDES